MSKTVSKPYLFLGNHGPTKSLGEKTTPILTPFLITTFQKCCKKTCVFPTFEHDTGSDMLNFMEICDFISTLLGCAAEKRGGKYVIFYQHFQNVLRKNEKKKSGLFSGLGGITSLGRSKALSREAEGRLRGGGASPPR